VIDGAKTFITNGSVADVALILARVDQGSAAQGITLFLVPTNTRGYFSTNISGKMGMRCADLAQLSLVDCRVPADSVVGVVGKGMRIALQSIGNARLGIAAGCVGGAQRCLDACLKYAQERYQFGKPIGSFQLVQGVLADMATELEAARYLTYHAAVLKSKGLPHNKETAMAKYNASEMLVRATTDP
jgi:alkylation response protein AidB-like acyl-CoA dehydrogenase